MLYTSYLSQLDKLPKNSIKLIVTRYLPNDLNILRYDKLYLVQELSPSKELLNKYNSSKKSYDDWVEFRTQFYHEMTQRNDMKYNIEKVNRALEKGLDVFLICYERNYNMCHRKLLAEYISKEFKKEWREF